MPLNDARRSQLDGIVHQMATNGEPDAAIQFVVNDFKTKYEAEGARTASADDQASVASGVLDAPRSDAPGILDVAKGFVKGAGQTVTGLGSLVRKAIPDRLEQGMDRMVPPVTFSTTANNPAEQFGKYAETATELAPVGVGVVKAAKAVPGMVARGLGISGVRAAENLASAANAAKNVALDVNGPGTAALRVTELGERGASVPRVVQNFMRRVTDPAKGPLTFEEARDYYSNISRLSADEYGRLNPVVKRAVGAMRESLQQSLTEAAGKVGKAEQYTAGIDEYRRAAKAKELASALTPSAGTVIKYGGGGALTGAIANAIINRR